MVFGSLARVEASRRSDLDLIVVVDTDARFLDRYDALLAPIAHRRFIASVLRARRKDDL